jgi:hypothetical protein
MVAVPPHCGENLVATAVTLQQLHCMGSAALDFKSQLCLQPANFASTLQTACIASGSTEIFCSASQNMWKRRVHLFSAAATANT